MPANRLFKRSIQIVLPGMVLPGMIVALVALPAQWSMAAQGDEPETVTLQDDPGAAYQSAQAAMRANQPDRAREELAKVQASGDGTWQAIARSASLAVDGDLDGARGAAQEAVNGNGESPWTHYHLGFVAYRQNDWGTAANECDRATQLNNDLAYAHYYAGLAFQKQRQSAKAGEHLQKFLQLAPEAPERDAIRVILRTLG